MIALLMLSVALPIPINIIHHHQRHQVVVAQTNDENNNNNPFKLYENATYAIHIQYPFNWTIKEGDVYSDDGYTDIVSFFAPVENDPESEVPSLYISIDSLSSNRNENLSEYLTTTINDYYNDSEDFKVIESNANSILGGKPAYKLVSTDVYDDGTISKSMEIGTIIGDKLYLLSYEAEDEKQYSEYLPIIQKMIDSFRIIS
jgi:eukaryotic-like serine/threonine-protein kinase